MEISIQPVSLFTAIILTGLSAGLFYAWEVSVIPGTRKVSNTVYLETMQLINRAIYNPGFFVIYFGSLLLLILSTIQHFHTGTSFWILLAATICYLIGTFAVTAFGNIPLNNALDILDLSALSTQQITAFRENYEQQWNLFHHIRTLFSVIAFLLAVLVLFIQNSL